MATCQPRVGLGGTRNGLGDPARPGVSECPPSTEWYSPCISCSPRQWPRCAGDTGCGMLSGRRSGSNRRGAANPAPLGLDQALNAGHLATHYPATRILHLPDNLAPLDVSSPPNFDWFVSANSRRWRLLIVPAFSLAPAPLLGYSGKGPACCRLLLSSRRLTGQQSNTTPALFRASLRRATPDPAGCNLSRKYRAC